MWNNGRFSRNAYTTTYTDFRVARKVLGEDGEYHTEYATVRRPVTTIEPDGYVAGGRTGKRTNAG